MRSIPPPACAKIVVEVRMPRKRPTNSAVARGIGTTEPDAASWFAFDRLPRVLRKLLWEAPVAINPLSAEQLQREGGTDEARAALTGAIGEEVQRFDAQHQQDHGYPLPAVTARVAPLRYRDGAPTKAAKPEKRFVFRLRRRPKKSGRSILG